MIKINYTQYIVNIVVTVITFGFLESGLLAKASGNIESFFIDMSRN